jgi:Lon protease-like protein
MTNLDPFKPALADLPDRLPIFPLPQALLLPHGQLPLHIFEPRYVAMVLAALQSKSRLIGMIQPRDEDDMSDTAPLYGTGCAGRISSFQETEDGRLMITLTGVCRFKYQSDQLQAGGFRLAEVTWDDYAHDLLPCAEQVKDLEIDRSLIISGLRQSLKRWELSGDWSVVEQASDGVLINTLSVVCPFAPQEQQALLEAPSLQERAMILACLLNIIATGGDCVN